MKRIVTASIIFIFIISSCITAFVFIKNKTNEFSDILQNAYTQAKSNNKDESIAQIDNFIKRWHKSEKYLMLLINREYIDEITVASQTLNQYLRYEEYPEFFAEIKKVMALLNHMLDTEMPQLRNIF